jgi:hypothetical protein
MNYKDNKGTLNTSVPSGLSNTLQYVLMISGVGIDSKIELLFNY